jgi:cytochrome c oxidase subunit 2
MKGVIEVLEQAEYDAKMASQSPYYYTAFPDKDPANAKTDSVKLVAKPVEPASKVTAKL